MLLLKTQMFLSFIFILILMPYQITANENLGDICIRPLSKEKYTGPNMLNNKFNRKNCQTKLEIQINNATPRKISELEGAWFKNLPVSSEHMLKIIKNDRVISSFAFRFKDKSWPKLMLWRNSGYCTWSLKPRGKKYPKCPWPKDTK